MTSEDDGGRTTPAMSSTRPPSPSLPLLPDSRVRFKSPEQRSRPIVHYPDNIDDEKPRRPGYHTSASADAFSPRPLSSAGTDDDSDEYDWSGEDDLVDEEAKYEKKMGVSDVRHNHWGIRRSVPIDFHTAYTHHPSASWPSSFHLSSVPP